MQCLSALKILQRNGYIETTEEITVNSRIMFVISREDLYKYQVANRQTDAFIKLLLRSYTGLFSNYANINEDDLAKYFQCSRDTVIEILKKMSSQKIISYIPQKRTPFIIFTEERLDEKSIIISPQSYDLLKEHYTQRVNAVIKYCINDQTCRSRQLTEYFGETQGKDCGQCDVCRSKQVRTCGSEEFDEIFDTIFRTIKTAPATIDSIVQSTSHDQNRILYVLQKMLDDQVVSQNPSGEYCITEETSQE